MRRRIQLTALFIFVFCSSSLSAEEKPSALAIQVVKASISSDFLSVSLQSNIVTKWSPLFRAVNGDAAAAQKFSEIIDQKAKEASGAYFKFIAIEYDKAFSQKELADLLIFYRSETGRAFLAKGFNFFSEIQNIAEVVIEIIIWDTFKALRADIEAGGFKWPLELEQYYNELKTVHGSQQ